MWRTLFAAIDLNGDNVIDFEEFLTFVTQLKRGGAEAKRRLCFRLFDSNQDGFAEKADFRCILETKLAVLRRPSWQTSTTVASSGTEAPDEYMQFFSLCDEDSDGRICYEDFETYCAVHGEGIVHQTLKILEVMFDGVIEETGIIITATDVRNTKPHIDWQDRPRGSVTFGSRPIAPFESRCPVAPIVLLHSFSAKPTHTMQGLGLL
ncbi:Calsenilin (A-type potassium channel modulatory protein 3) (DRE-antagonist modulator) (DREAM) (Kv channel-interacting protein 3) (KChIP3) [Durusdinium trenchii]|uniref:Calsenilin (A-type potassium channel modulatory protein 3) (DRE-antagonist modulator) (DREAM) (Kv channel-interacting protein 3) (KChIP3) n=1 Tax=Durusdinium trenchii TaxID=1381693 RepID=A0ABP0HYJ7_9DINO